MYAQVFLFLQMKGYRHQQWEEKKGGGVYRHNKSQFIGSELNNLSVTPLYSS